MTSPKRKSLESGSSRKGIVVTSKIGSPSMFVSSCPSANRRFKKSNPGSDRDSETNAVMNLSYFKTDCNRQIFKPGTNSAFIGAGFVI